MQVQLITHTPHPEGVCALAARMCYSPGMPSMNKTDDDNRALLRKVLGMGHESVAEHAVFTFGIDGISRACSHQLVRHRVASYSQQSQRYVKAGGMPDVVLPASINSQRAKDAFSSAMVAAWDAYKILIEEGITAEDARFVLPNAATTRLVVTSRNLRAGKTRSCGCMRSIVAKQRIQTETEGRRSKSWR